jgi:hypothetical protein
MKTDQMQTDRKIARRAGILFLLPLLTYGIGSGLTSAILEDPDYLAKILREQTQFLTGALLMLVNSILVAVIPIVLFPLLERQSPAIAIGYLVSRIVESMLLIVGTVCLMLVITISSDNTLGTLAVKANALLFQVAMIVLGLGSLFFCSLLWRSKRLPGFLAVWGGIGYALLLTGAVAELFGWKIGVPLAIPGGLFELFLAGWLFFKGFKPQP